MKNFIYLFVFTLLISFAHSQIEIGDSGDSIQGVIIDYPLEPSSTISGNLTNFTELTDTPSSYAGAGGDCVAVKNDETGLEFITCSSGGGGGNPFDQSLNTTDNVTFHNLSLTGDAGVSGTVDVTGGIETGDEYVLNSRTLFDFSALSPGTIRSGFDVAVTQWNFYTGGVLRMFIDSDGYVTGRQGFNTTNWANLTASNQTAQGWWNWLNPQQISGSFVCTPENGFCNQSTSGLITLAEYFANATQEFYPLNSNPKGYLNETSEVNVTASWNFTQSLTIEESTACTPENGLCNQTPGGNPFDQVLNISSNVTFFNATITNDAYVGGDAEIEGNTQVNGYVNISGDANVTGNGHIEGNGTIKGKATVNGGMEIIGGEIIINDTSVTIRNATAFLFGGAIVGNDTHNMIVSSDGLTFSTGFNYKVANNAFAFQSDSFPLAGLTFSSTNLAFDFTNLGGTRIIAGYLGFLGNDGGLWSRHGFALEETTPAVLSANQNNYAAVNNEGFLRLNSTAAVSISGFAAPPASLGAKEVIMFNIGTNTISILHQSASSSAANRVISPTGATLNLNQDDGVRMIYDPVTARWRAWRLV